MKLVALWCSYEGAGFHGYQAQGTLRTVQGELLRAFREAELPRNPVVAGRTDKGVSARMQVLSCRVLPGTREDDVTARLNARLPPDLRICLTRPAPSGFHAAWSATSREYRYVLPGSRDVRALREVGALFPGTRDFRVFHFKTSDARPRTLSTLEVLEGEGLVTLRFVGTSFGRHMVRMITAAMLGVADGSLRLEDVRAGLDALRNFHCPLAPPEPLTLWEIGYPAEADPFAAERH